MKALNIPAAKRQAEDPMAAMKEDINSHSTETTAPAEDDSMKAMFEDAKKDDKKAN